MRVDYTRIGVGVPVALAAAIAAGCDRTPPPALEIGGIGVPESALTALGELERQMLGDIVAFGAAVARGETDALGAPVIGRAAQEALAAALPYSLAARSLGWDEEDLRTAYADQPEWELVVRHVVRLADAATGQAARDSARRVAEQVAERARVGEDFAQLAATFSQEPGAAERGGLLEPGRQGSWVDPFWHAALSLAPGQTSGAVETVYGYHVIRLEERRPVPFEQASRTALLQRAVPAQLATRAAEEWADAQGEVSVDSMAAAAALIHIQAGTAIPDSLVIVRGFTSAEYTGIDLATGWAQLDPAERTAVESGGADALARWVEGDARTVFWSRAAADAGLDVPETARRSAELVWTQRVATWAQAFGFAPEATTEASILGTARQALLSGSPEARAARLELRSLRPLLREHYPMTDAG
jgi:hypothetical protein